MAKKHFVAIIIIILVLSLELEFDSLNVIINVILIFQLVFRSL